MLEEIRLEYELLQASPSADLNSLAHVWEKAYAEYRNLSDAEEAFPWLSLIIEITEHMTGLGSHSFDSLRLFTVRLNYVLRFGRSSHPEVWKDSILWLTDFIGRFDIVTVQNMNLHWKDLDITEIRRIGHMRAVLAYLEDCVLTKEMTKEIPELADWLKLQGKLLR